jgi:hypothetical protein
MTTRFGKPVASAELGKIAFDMLYRMEELKRPKPETNRLSTSLVVRRSTAKAATSSVVAAGIRRARSNSHGDTIALVSNLSLTLSMRGRVAFFPGSADGRFVVIGLDNPRRLHER